MSTRSPLWRSLELKTPPIPVSQTAVRPRGLFPLEPDMAEGWFTETNCRAVSIFERFSSSLAQSIRTEVGPTASMARLPLGLSKFPLSQYPPLAFSLDQRRRLLRPRQSWFEGELHLQPRLWISSRSRTHHPLCENQGAHRRC